MKNRKGKTLKRGKQIRKPKHNCDKEAYVKFFPQAYYFVDGLPKYEEIIDWTLKDFNFNTDITLHLVLRLGFKQDPFVYNKEDWFN